MNQNKKIKTYSFSEARKIVGEYIEESASRLQQRLQKEWKKQTSLTQKERDYAKHSV